MDGKIYSLRLKNLRDLAKNMGGRNILCERADISYNLLTQYIGKNPTINIGEEFARKIERNLALENYWLDKDHTEINGLKNDNSLIIDKDNLIYIKSLDINLSAGKGELVFVENQDGLTPVSRELLRELGAKPESCCAVYVKGDCMAPEINDGDQVIVDLNTREIFNGAIYAIRFNGEVMVKRLYKNFDESIKIICDNPLEKVYFPDTTLTADQAGQILGVVGEVIIIQKKAKRRRQ